MAILDILLPFFAAHERRFTQLRQQLESCKDDHERHAKLRDERAKIYTRLQFLALVASLTASVEATVLSWDNLPESPWIARALWHVALDMSVHSLGSSLAQICAISFHSFKPRAAFPEITKPKIFLVTYPYITLYYSAIFLLTGHLAYTLAPLGAAARIWAGDQKVAVFYLVWVGLSIAPFAVAVWVTLS